MLHKRNRLAKRKDIETAFAKGRTFFNPFFRIKFLPEAGQKRFTIVVSTKVFKKAVARNRLKRILREHIRKNLTGFKNGNYLIMASTKVSNLEEKNVLPNFLNAASKIK